MLSLPTQERAAEPELEDDLFDLGEHLRSFPTTGLWARVAVARATGAPNLPAQQPS